MFSITAIVGGKRIAFYPDLAPKNRGQSPIFGSSLDHVMVREGTRS
jgi:hypothetical protein